MDEDSRLSRDELRETVAAVVPCYNAGGRAMAVVAELSALLNHIVVVDDGSNDGCTDTLSHLPITLIRFSKNRGKGHALLAGFKAALALPRVTCAVVVDADGQHDPRELARLFETFRNKQADLVIGSRAFESIQVPWRNRLGNRLTKHVTRWLLKQDIPDTQSGFRLHSRRFLDKVVETVAGGRYETEMEILIKAVREGYKVVAVPIRTIYEPGNVSSHFNQFTDSIRIYWRLFRTAWHSRGMGTRDS